MSEQLTTAVVGNDTPPGDLAAQLGTFAKQLDDIASEMAKAKDTDTGRFNELKAEQDRIAAEITPVKDKYEAEVRDGQAKAAGEAASEMRAFLANQRTPAKSIGGTPYKQPQGYEPGSFIYGVYNAAARDYERQVEGKASLKDLSDRLNDVFPQGNLDGSDAKAATFQPAWGKSTLGATDAAGGWIIPNAVVDEFITPATVDNIYRALCTVVPGVTAAAVDIPFRSAARARAAIAAFGATKENVDLAYNGYTATMYTLARIYDIGNQFLRQSRGAAERDVLSELAAAFAQGEAFYIREGTGSSQPFGYTSALTNGPAAFRTSFTASATTLAGSMATAIASAAGAAAGRGVRVTAAVMSASSYWTMVAQGTDSAGFFFAPATGPESIRPGTLMTPWGLPVYPDADADLEGTAAVIDNLVVGDWKKFKVYFGQSYRVDSSDQAGTRWDTNLTGFRGEEEMGFDARPAVYAGHFQMITDITP